MKQYFFFSGLPRSGSTVLCALLNQHPDVFVTPTSPLLDQLIFNQDIFKSIQQVRRLEQIQLDNITRNIIDEFWSHQSANIIIDKNRGWAKNIQAANYLFNSNVKIIFMIRDLPSIMASWLQLLKNNPSNHIDQIILKNGIELTDEARMDEMWNNMVKDCVECIKPAQQFSDQVLFVQYDEFVADPLNTLYNIESFYGIEHCNAYDINNIVNPWNDNDLSAWGLNGIHTIRSTISRSSTNAIDVLGQSMYEKFNQLGIDIRNIQNGK